MEARSFPYDRGKTGWAAAAAAVRFATRQEEAETAVLRTLGVPEPGVPDITPTRHGTPSAERETAALHILEVPRLDAPDITPICHGTPNAGAGGHKMLMGDDREAGLGLGDQDCGESAVARQDTEKESFMAEERGDYRQDAHMNDRSHVSGTPLFGGG